MEVEKEAKNYTFKVDTSKGDEKNFEMFYNYEGYRDPKLLIQRNLEYPDQAALMVNFFPDFQSDELETAHQTGLAEYIFILDRSGSMWGDRIETSKAVLISFLEALPTGSKYNVMSFGTGHNLLHPESRPVSEENIEESVKEIRTFGADMCGNNLLAALKTIFAMKRELPLSLFLLTDGH